MSDVGASGSELRRDPSLPQVMAYLSHAKDTDSLPAVARMIATEAPEYRLETREWWRNHAA